MVSVSCSHLQDVFQGSVRSTRSPLKVAKRSKKEVKLKAINPDSGVRTPITTNEGTYYFVAEGDTLTNISKGFKIDAKYIAKINNLYDSQLVVGRRLFIPHKKKLALHVDIEKMKSKRAKKSVEQRKKELLAKRLGNKRVRFIWPVKGGYLSSGYGRRRGRPHDGVDIAAKRGTPIMAAESGVVLFSRRFSGYGNLVVIKHANQYFSAYAHAHRIFVKQGQVVKKGQKIALVGSTGRSTGPHVHFEIRKKAQSIDPVALLPSKNQPQRLSKK